MAFSRTVNARALKKRRHEQKAAHQFAMREEIAQLPDQGVRLTRNDKFEILAEHQQNPVFLEYVRQHHQDEDQQRDE